MPRSSSPSDDWPEPTPLDRLRGRMLQTFARDHRSWPPRYVCRVCGQGSISELGQYAHIRHHRLGEVARMAALHETVVALFGEEQ